jgi:hypothetical protein
MAATRLTDSQKSELVARYRDGEGSGELAAAYGCSVNTVSRVVKAALPADEYERLKQERARGGRAAAGSSPLEPVELELPQAAAVAPELAPALPAETPDLLSAPDPEPEAVVSVAAEDDGDSDERLLAIDDADDFGDDGAGEDDSDDEESDEESSEDDIELVSEAAAEQLHEPVTCLPLAEAELPASVYMLVDKTVELEARPLRDFPELGVLPPDEEERQALQVFVNPRQAKRHCGRSQRVIKIPDTRIFERTASYLIAQGISRVVMENGLYSLPGA